MSVSVIPSFVIFTQDSGNVTLEFQRPLTDGVVDNVNNMLLDLKCPADPDWRDSTTLDLKFEKAGG